MFDVTQISNGATSRVTNFKNLHQTLNKKPKKKKESNSKDLPSNYTVSLWSASKKGSMISEKRKQKKDAPCHPDTSCDLLEKLVPFFR